MSSERCETCRFWLPYERDEGHLPIGVPELNVGACRRYPPHDDGRDKVFGLGLHPNTHFDNWCGEYVEKDEPQPT